jgi:hypothetical protein
MLIPALIVMLSNRGSEINLNSDPLFERKLKSTLIVQYAYFLLKKLSPMLIRSGLRYLLHLHPYLLHVFTCILNTSDHLFFMPLLNIGIVI